MPNSFLKLLEIARLNPLFSMHKAFSRLKGQHSLNHIRVRGLRRLTVHCYLSLIALQGKTVVLPSVQPTQPLQLMLEPFVLG